jgi:hypothetical protein
VIVGPFNFSIDQKEQNCDNPDVWRALEECEEVKPGSVDIKDLNRVTRLG